MQPIQNLLNKIKWDKRENPEQYSIFYYDRIIKKLIEIPYTKIKRIEGSFMVLNNEEESNIPLHRIKKVAKNNIIVWERKH
ncbi:MAG: DUF504 domain-containing protein [Candidatus Woesearchaeota archaeon]|jgi:uncharacterized protein (UPF0248 family)|nr:DUF504 domain-containing protein [Candidatus Woesearchaeota archaeon]|tara:strand:+ start:1943 stop:2185 length:243 start_codon:yes stop_codon:yes gene_type:complete